MTDYTPQELMVVAAAREIHDGEVVFVGMRLPLLAFALAKRTHAPTAIGLFENGLLLDRVPPPGLFTMSDPPIVAAATQATGLLDVMCMLQRGEVHLGFVGGAEVDRLGNINTSVIGSPANPTVKLPGSGGAADIACLAQRLVSLMEHAPRRLRERVDFITSPGTRASALVTTLAVLRFDPDAYLASYHPFTTPGAVAAATGWQLRIAADCRPTPAPTTDELRLIREADPLGFWTRSR